MSPPLCPLGYAEAAFASRDAFTGVTVDNTTVLMRYTYFGDANLDGRVNALDFNLLASNFGGSSKQWFNGDFNYNGTVNTQDFTMLASNFGQVLTIAAPPLGSNVPEPSSIAVLAMLTAITQRRKR